MAPAHQHSFAARKTRSASAGATMLPAWVLRAPSPRHSATVHPRRSGGSRAARATAERFTARTVRRPPAAADPPRAAANDGAAVPLVGEAGIAAAARVVTSGSHTRRPATSKTRGAVECRSAVPCPLFFFPPVDEERGLGLAAALLFGSTWRRATPAACPSSWYRMSTPCSPAAKAPSGAGLPWGASGSPWWCAWWWRCRWGWCARADGGAPKGKTSMGRSLGARAARSAATAWSSSSSAARAAGGCRSSSAVAARWTSVQSDSCRMRTGY
mmetsp:Transcript_16246/g.50438  ORF Transcript_16246/g.50438 Transcript_16246/m.50438 type:complete len:271 (+) Transcript_16246:845-1657(+)